MVVLCSCSKKQVKSCIKNIWSVKCIEKLPVLRELKEGTL